MKNITQGFGSCTRNNRVYWLLLSFLGLFLLATPAHAATELSPSLPVASSATTGSQSVLEDIEVRNDGIILRTSGQTPQIEIRRSGDRTWMTIEMRGVSIAPGLTRLSRGINRNDATSLQVRQISTSPSTVRVTLNLNRNAREWQASSDRGGVVMWPSGGTPPAIAPSTSGGVPTPSTPGGVATIQSVELINNGMQLLVNADKPFTPVSGWDRRSAAYRISIPAAQLPPTLKLPKPNQGSPLLWVRSSLESPQTVVLLLQPAAGIQIRVNQPSREQLSLQLERSEIGVTPPPIDPTPDRDPTPRPPVNPPVTPNPLPPRPSLPTNKRVVVVIDPGHGGRDPGAVGIRGLREKDIVLDVSEQVAQILEQQGVQAIMSRRDDREVDLAPRVQLAERVKANLFVSIHANAIDLSRPDISGIETYYYESGLRLARYIHSSILQTTGSRDRGVRRARFYVLRNTSMPAVLVETGFVTGREDAARLSTAAYRTQMAQAIARGIMQYIQNR